MHSAVATYLPTYFVQSKVIPIHTGKSLSEALILALTNPWYDDRLFIELRVQYIKIASSEHEVDHVVLNVKTKTKKPICVHNMFSTCSELGSFMYWTRNSMNNLLSYFRLSDARMSASDKE